MTRRDLSRAELQDLHSVLRRACERAERKRSERGDKEADQLALAVADLNDELARMP